MVTATLGRHAMERGSGPSESAETDLGHGVGSTQRRVRHDDLAFYRIALYAWIVLLILRTKTIQWG